MLTFTLYLLLGILCVCVGIIVPFFILLGILSIPCALYEGHYREKHGLPEKNYKEEPFPKIVKNIFNFYWCIVRFKKPTFD